MIVVWLNIKVYVVKYNFKLNIDNINKDIKIKKLKI